MSATTNPSRHAKSRSAQSFLEKTLSGISDALEQALFADEIAGEPGLVQSLDPRVKLIATIAFLLAVSLSHNPLVILGIYLLTLPIAYASHVPLGFYFKRVWVLMPFFTGIVALPALFNIFSPGQPLVTLLALPNFTLSITEPGVITAAFLLLRVGTSVSIGVLLVLTTRWILVLNALRVLRVPQAFVLIMGMTYRYIYLFLHSVNDMFLSRKSRLVGRVSAKEDRQWLGAAMGTMLAKSYDLSDEVYLAMQSRGFRGEAKTMEEPALHQRDWLGLALFLVVAAGFIWLGRQS